MANSPKLLPPKGDDDALLMFRLVGEALSWWEASEDILLALFRTICDGREPVAVRSYIEAPRKVRSPMLLLALETYSYMFVGNEVDNVKVALKALDKLSSVRNQIAHGHVSRQTHQVDGELVADGIYLLPNLNEGLFFDRMQFRFSHSCQSIENFTLSVRKHRGDIMDVWTDVMMRNQTSMRFGTNYASLYQTIQEIARLELLGDAAIDRLKRDLAYMDQHGKASV